MNGKTTSVFARIQKLTAETTRSLKAELRALEEEGRRVTAELSSAAERIRGVLRSLGNKTLATGRSSFAVAKSAGSTRARKRIRRSPEQLQQVGASVVAFIKSKVAQGASGVEIRKLHPKIGPDIKGFVAKFGGQKLRTTGAKSTMRYFVR